MKNFTLPSIQLCKSRLAAAMAFMGITMAGVAMAQVASVPTAVVQTQNGGASYALDGVVQAVRQSTVGAQASGRIATMLVKAGDRVRAGQLLATIDDQETQAGVSRSQAQVAQADAELRNAQAQMDRTRELQGVGFVSKAALDTADAQLKSAKAQREQAQAGAKLASLSQGFTKVTAPFDGWILQTHAEAGDLATPGKPLLTLYAPQPLRVAVQVPASRSLAVRSASKTELLVQEDGGATRAVLPVKSSMVPASDPVSQTSEWRFDLATKDSEGLVPGQQILARFTSAQAAASQALLVPRAAVVRRGELTGVYVASGNAFALRAVRLGVNAGNDTVEVLSGLKQGELVALDPLRAAGTSKTK